MQGAAAAVCPQAEAPGQAPPRFGSGETQGGRKPLAMLPTLPLGPQGCGEDRPGQDPGGHKGRWESRSWQPPIQGLCPPVPTPRGGNSREYGPCLPTCPSGRSRVAVKFLEQCPAWRTGMEAPPGCALAWPDRAGVLLGCGQVLRRPPGSCLTPSPQALCQRL